jgi:hypothetical protein
MATCDMGTWDGMVTADTAGHGHGNLLVGLTRTVNRSAVHGTDRSPMAMPTSPVPVSGMKEGAGRLAQTETLESSGILWLLVFSQWPIIRHADMATTTKTLLPCPPKEQSAKTNSAALRSKRKGTRIRSPTCFAIHL